MLRIAFALLTLFTTFPVLANEAGAAAIPARPNVLFIAVDDLRPELGCYGVDVVKSPNIDRLAASGMRFDRHYVQFAVCIPSRVSLLTSLRPERTHQVYGPIVWTRVKGARPLGETFGSAGYRTVSLGKIWHVENSPFCDKFDVRWTPKGGKYASSQAEQSADEYRKAKQAVQKQGKANAEPNVPLPPITECADVPDGTYADGMIADEAIKELRAASKAGKPLMLAVGFIKPHLPFCAPKKYWDLYDEAAMQLAPNPDFPRDMPPIAFNNHPNFFSYSYGSYAPLEKGKAMPEATARHLIRGYRAATSYVDAQIGRVLDELERLGMAEDTIVMLWGDHGWHLGDSGMWSKHSNFECAARSPLIVRAPGVTKAGAATDALVETVDIFPSLLELCGLPRLEVYDGRSFAPLLKNPETDGKDAVFHVFNRGGEVGGKRQSIIGHAVRTPTHRLVSWRVGWGMDNAEYAAELYDYVRDPYETQNLADKPEYAQLRADLEQKLRNGPAGTLPPK
ncbi:MAG: sulfatase [Planctomycetota bacterium]